MMLSIDVVNLGRRCPWLRHCANNGDLRAKLMFILHHVLESIPHLPTSIRTPNKDWTRRQRLTQSSNVDTTLPPTINTTRVKQFITIVPEPHPYISFPTNFYLSPGPSAVRTFRNVWVLSDSGGEDCQTASVSLKAEQIACVWSEEWFDWAAKEIYPTKC